MRGLAVTLALAAFALLPLAAATPRDNLVARAARRQCPAVKITCPDAARPGENTTFTVSVDAAAADINYTFKWEVSAGTIASGQGTPSVKVDTTGVSAPVAATVEVGGLPPSCERYASCAAALIVGPRCGRALDEYGDIPFEDERARLDNFAIYLQEDPASSGYIVCYGARVGYEGEARRRCDRARDYVSKVRGVAADRIVAEDGGFRESLSVAFWLVPQGATRPAPMPTVDPSEVTILKRKSARKPRGR